MSPPPQGERATGNWKGIQGIQGVNSRVSPLHKRFGAEYSSLLLRLDEHGTTRHAWCEQCLPGRRKPDVLIPDSVGMRGSYDYAAMAMHDVEYPPLLPPRKWLNLYTRIACPSIHIIYTACNISSKRAIFLLRDDYIRHPCGSTDIWRWIVFFVLLLIVVAVLVVVPRTSSRPTKAHWRFIARIIPARVVITHYMYTSKKYVPKINYANKYKLVLQWQDILTYYYNNTTSTTWNKPWSLLHPGTCL